MVPKFAQRFLITAAVVVTGAPLYAAVCGLDGVQVYQPYTMPADPNNLVSATECVIGGDKNDGDAYFLDPLKAGTLFTTVLPNAAQWTLLGKSDDGGVKVVADEDNVTGSFELDTTPTKVDTFAVTLKGGTENFRAFLFTSLQDATKFYGVFDTGKAGLLKDGDGQAQDLSHLSAAIYGILDDDDQQEPPDVVPLPAGLPLLLAALGGLGLAARRRNKQ